MRVAVALDPSSIKPTNQPGDPDSIGGRYSIALRGRYAVDIVPFAVRPNMRLGLARKTEYRQHCVVKTFDRCKRRDSNIGMVEPKKFHTVS